MIERCRLIVDIANIVFGNQEVAQMVVFTRLAVQVSARAAGTCVMESSDVRVPYFIPQCVLQPV